MEISQKEGAIKITQEKYIESILKKEGIEYCNPVAMPMDPNIKLTPNPDGNDGNQSNSYACLLGELQFLANAMPPDIAYAVNKLSVYTANPSLQHIGALKRIIRYLAGTKSLGIMYQKQPRQNNLNFFHGYSDTAYANTDDFKSMSRYVFLAAGGAITWRSKKQTTIALSSTKAKYVELSEAGCEACWLRSLCEELGITQEEPSLIKGDNNSSIAMAKNPQFHKRGKHIVMHWHWVQDMVTDGAIAITDCRDPDQTADIFMKALPRRKHQKHTNEMGLTTT
jgi:hypothetical protein